MQNLDLNNLGVQEMDAVEMKECDGGGYFKYLDYYKGDNELIYFLNACGNAGIAIANGAIALAKSGAHQSHGQ